MEFAYLLGGGAPIVKKYQVGEAMATAGVPVIAEAAQATAGIALASTTGAANMVGVTLDTQDTLVTAQQTDNSDPERVVTVLTNSDAVWKAKLSGGAGTDTALTLRTVSTASTTGLTVTTGDDFNATDLEDNCPSHLPHSSAAHWTFMHKCAVRNRLHIAIQGNWIAMYPICFATDTEFNSISNTCANSGIYSLRVCNHRDDSVLDISFDECS